MTKYGLWMLGITMPLLSITYGTTWDEEQCIEYANELLNYYFSFGEDRTALDVTRNLNSHMIYFGNLFSLLSALIQKIIPINIVTLRHMLNAFLGFSCIFYAVKIVKLTNNDRAALLTLVLLVLFPRFFGLAMNAFRDTAFAFGFIASAYYMIKISRDLPNINKANWFKLSLTIFFTSDIRIVGLILFAYLGLILLIRLLQLRKQENLKVVVPRIVRYSLATFVLSYFLMVLTWPYALQDMVQNPFEALTELSNFSLTSFQQLYMGELTSSNHMPWHYLFVWLGISTPIVLLFGILLFVVLSLILSNRNNTVALPVLIFLFIPLLLNVFGKFSHFDGWRHYLFLAPFMAIVAALGWDMMFNAIRHAMARKITVVGFVLLLALPLHSSIQYHPNQHVYFNELIGGLKGAYGQFEVDTYANVMRQGVEWLNANIVDENLVIASNNTDLAFAEFGNEFLAKTDVKWLRHDEMFQTPWDYALVTPRRLTAHKIKQGLWPPREAVHHITIDGVPILSVLKRQEYGLVKGLQFMKDGNAQEGLAKMHEALNFYHLKEEAYVALGKSYYEIKDPILADKMLKSALQLEEDNYDANFYSGMIQFDKKQYSSAQEYFLKCVELFPTGYNAMFFLAKCYQLQNSHKSALTIYEYLLNNGIYNQTEYETNLLYDYAYSSFQMAKSMPGNNQPIIADAEQQLIRLLNIDKGYEPAYYLLWDIYSATGRSKKAAELKNYLDGITN